MKVMSQGPLPESEATFRSAVDSALGRFYDVKQIMVASCRQLGDGGLDDFAERVAVSI
jgi:hypothetical protein